MIRCVVIDDEPLAIEVMENYISRMDELFLSSTFTNPVLAYSYLQKHPVDIVFIDINMPVLSGLDILRCLGNDTKVIITTAYREHAVDGFELNATDYLVKPIPFQRFLQSVHKAIKLLLPTADHAAVVQQELSSQEALDELWIRVDKKLRRIDIHSILYMESLKDYIRIKTTREDYITYHTLSGVMEKLSATEFIRVHKSFIVALKKIDAVEGNILLIQNKQIPLGRQYKQELLNRIDQAKGNLLR